MIRGRLRTDESGFTLAELLVAIVIMGIITVPLFESFIDGLRTTTAASTSLGSSHDAQLADYYLERDAIGATPSESPSSWTCAAAAGVTVGAAPAPQGVVQFTWTQAPVYSGTLPSGLPSFNPGVSYESDYIYQGPKLTRYLCTVTGGVAGTPQATEVASSLSLTVAPTATPSGCDSKESHCTSVLLTDPAGRQYTTLLYERSSP